MATKSSSVIDIQYEGDLVLIVLFFKKIRDMAPYMSSFRSVNSTVIFFS